ncbi:protein lifeguard 3-like isoform X2 [Takifugu rubripes]|uniref:protein lifeguard 3-like isoform X2 n=1 Tax=Takifugu rubripes TaxID=31033 RepID=UPI001145BC2C|nr:protein lifeguard 3-like isoform X2 [Takifugu rubripes]XP_056891110.1 protein lifeguard 3-like isoform X2 [Takifugu flavidus]
MTSKTDSPPPYEDALHPPKYGSYPLQPQQGSHIPPPSYSPSPGVCPSLPGYWGQEGVYPPAGMWAAPGFPPSGVPITVPALSAGAPASNIGEMDDFLRTQWESTSIRHGFIRKVYLILTAQLAVTISVVAVFTFVDPVRLFVIRYPGIYWASFVVYFIVYCILICCKEPRRRFPWNLVLLGVFLLRHEGGVPGHGDNGFSVRRCHRLLLPNQSGLHLLWGLSVYCRRGADGHRGCHCHRPLLPICALATYALCCNRSRRLYSVFSLQHPASYWKPGTGHQS